MLCLLALASVVGCGSTDLPAGWSGAARIDDFTQTECNGSAFGGPAAVVGVEGVSTGVELDYEHAVSDVRRTSRAFCVVQKERWTCSFNRSTWIRTRSRAAAVCTTSMRTST
jgi:hypothetical protein